MSKPNPQPLGNDCRYFPRRGSLTARNQTKATIRKTKPALIGPRRTTVLVNVTLELATTTARWAATPQ